MLTKICHGLYNMNSHQWRNKACGTSCNTVKFLYKADLISCVFIAILKMFNVIFGSESNFLL